jgi:hypothetical protein
MDNEIDLASVVKKRGRKPIGERAMTAAEAKRASRERLAANGSAEFMIRLDAGKLNLVTQLAEAGKVTRSEVMETLLDLGLNQVGLAIADAELLQEQGASEEVLRQAFRRRFGTTPEPFAIEKFKEVMGIR